MLIFNKKKKDTMPVIFEIDNHDYFIDKLYKDINYENGYFTLTNIHANRIKKLNIK